MKALIVGAGIGGLTAAAALRRVGIEATLFEQAGEPREAGAGIILAANAVTALREIGLAEDLLRLGAIASAVQIRSWRGKTLAELSTGVLQQRMGAPSVAVHRADLLRLLRHHLARDQVRLGARCSGFAQDDAGVTLLLELGREERAEVLIGADGLRSTVRAQMRGVEPPRYAGYTAWRAVVGPPRDLLDDGDGFESWGRGARFGCVPIGGGRAYWYAARNAPEGEVDGPLGTRAGLKATLLARFAGWHRPVVDLIAASAEREIRRDDIYDREPVAGVWGEGRVSLLGDAAHPMTPNLGQGACLAIEDAVVLARCLAGSTAADVPTALRRYEALRRHRTDWIVRRSRALGRVAQLEHPLLYPLRDAVLAAVPTEVHLRLVERVLRFDDRTVAVGAGLAPLDLETPA